MNLQELKRHHDEKQGKRRCPSSLRVAEYRKHYPLVREAVREGLKLYAIVRILREKEGAFAGRKDAAVWQAYRRALRLEGITLKDNEG